jgi:hypothetical protein
MRLRSANELDGKRGSSTCASYHRNAARST